MRPKTIGKSEKDDSSVKAYGKSNTNKSDRSRATLYGKQTTIKKKLDKIISRESA